MMRGFRLAGAGACVLLAAAAPLAGQTTLPDRSPDLAARADSLAALDPAAEVRAALARGDSQFIAVCGYVCFPPGLERRNLPSGRMHVVEGTSDFVMNVDMARLNKVAYDYARAYNQLVLAELRRARGVAPAEPR